MDLKNAIVTGIAHPTLQCCVTSIEYDYTQSELNVYMEKGHCADMGGAIELAVSIDPCVKQIQTFAGDQADTCYALIDKKWEVFTRH